MNANTLSETAAGRAGEEQIFSDDAPRAEAVSGVVPAAGRDDGESVSEQAEQKAVEKTADVVSAVWPCDSAVGTAAEVVVSAAGVEAESLAEDVGPLCECGGAFGGGEMIQPVVRVREEHSISRRDIDPDALKVLYRLARNKYTAFLVGGGVRDLLLGRAPKDFDISTDAKPEQIRSLFRNCILIGRRFRLAHIRYGEKIIETSTFRTTPKQQGDPSDPETDLFQRDDNLFGSPAEDALRRDFTVNGLFYDIESFSIIDYVGGMEDLEARRIRCIGDPCIRFREDPVRMIRAVRFASRLEFSLDPGTEAAIHQYGPELTKASPARLLEEITRLFAFSVGEKAVRLLRSTGLLNVILPEVDACLDSDKVNHDLFWKRLRALDCGDTVLPDATPALIFAVLLLDSLKMYMGRTWDFETTPRLRFDKLYSFMQPLSQRLRFPKKLTDRIIHMYLNQNRFCGGSALRGKPGSLSNFVTQDAFHESLALAEIILSAEGGAPTRLNQWREMLQERIYGREEGVRSGNGLGYGEGSAATTATSNSGNGNSTVSEVQVGGGNGRYGTRSGVSAAVEREIVPESSGIGGVEERGVESGGGSGRLSRSARRRRNKRLRKTQHVERDGSAAGGEESSERKDGSSVGESGLVSSGASGVSAAASGEPEGLPEAGSVRASGSGSVNTGARSGSGWSRNGRRGRRDESKREESKSESPSSPSSSPSSATPAVSSSSSLSSSRVGGVKDSEKEGVKGSSGQASGESRRRPNGSSRRGRGFEGGVERGGRREEASVLEHRVEDAPKPLTAAAFWKEPVSAEVPVEKAEEQKSRGRGGKPDSRGGKRKSVEKSESGDGGKDKKPLAPDRADEAEIPMHWLDEI